MALTLSSQAFANESAIPSKYTCDGENLSPPLEWSGTPGETRSFVLIVEDPDAPSGTFRHWAVFDIAAGRTLFPEGVGLGAKTEDLGHGVNDFGNRRYDGPCPPQGHGTHHYHFRLAALNVPNLSIRDSPGVGEVWEAAKPYIIEQTELVGTYSS